MAKDIPLYERDNYLIDTKFIRSANIIEYDIRQANINILLDSNLITKETYDKIQLLPKMDREITVGNMIRNNKSIGDGLSAGFKRAKKNLFSYNNIKDTEVVRIAKDAVYIMRNTPLKYTKFGQYIEFIPKNRYSMFARIGPITFFYNCYLDEINLDPIGLGQSAIHLHADYMLTFIGNLFYYIDSSKLSVTIDYFNDFYKKYINLELPVQYYRELNSDSLYMIKTPNGRPGYGISVVEEKDKDKLEIGYNAMILRQLFGLLTEIHQKQK